MKEIYDFVDSYVKLTYIVRRLNAKLNRLPDFMFSSGVDCNYREFGLDDSIVCKLEGEATIQELNECYKVLSDKVDAMTVKLRVAMTNHYDTSTFMRFRWHIK